MKAHPSTTEDPLDLAIQHAAHLLPSQGPIGVFIHHNTLHAFEHLAFEDAVVQAGKIYGCQPFMSADWYRGELAKNRIRISDLDWVVETETAADTLVAGNIPLPELRKALLLYPLHQVEGAGLRWHLSETGALWRFRQEVSTPIRERLERNILDWLAESPEKLSQRIGSLPDEWDLPSLPNLVKKHSAKAAVRALWTACRRAVHKVDLSQFLPLPKLLVRHRDFLIAGGLGDSDSLVHPFLIRFCSAFLDQGLAERRMPSRQQGLFKNFISLYGKSSGVLPYWLQGVNEILEDLSERNLSAADSATESLKRLGVQSIELGRYVQDTLLALKGWAGMVAQTQQRPDRLPLEPVPANLTEFLAIRLILDRFAISWQLKSNGVKAELSEIRNQLGQPTSPPVSSDSWGFQLFQISQFLGLTPQVLLNYQPEQITEILQAAVEFDDLQRRRMLHLAYERRFRIRELDALSLHPPYQVQKSPAFQAIFCIDEREESTRRHLEEVFPDCETFGALGYFSVPMYFKAAHEPHPVALCPGIITPRHLVIETATPEHESKAKRQASVRRWS